MLKSFLKDYSEDRVETFNFVLLTIFTWGAFSLYWLGKINKSYKRHTKNLLVSEGLIIIAGIFVFVSLETIFQCSGIFCNYRIDSNFGDVFSNVLQVVISRDW